MGRRGEGGRHTMTPAGVRRQSEKQGIEPDQAETGLGLE